MHGTIPRMSAVRPPALWLSIAATAISAVAVAAMVSSDGPRRPLTFAGAILLPDGYYNAPSQPATRPAPPSRPSASATRARPPATPSPVVRPSRYQPPPAWVVPAQNGSTVRPASSAPMPSPATTPPAPKPTSRVNTPRTGIPAPPNPDSSPAALAQTLFSAVNKERKKAGLPLLSWNAQLQRSAAAHNQAMAATNQLASRVGDEPALGARQANQGVAASYAAESVGFAAGNTPADVLAVHQQMLAEQPPDDRRRRNLLSTAVTAVGIDVLFDPVHGRLWITEDFARFS